MNIFIPGSSIFKTYFPPLKSAEIGCVTGGSGALDYYESRFLVVEASWMPFLFREKIGHLLPRHLHKTPMSFHFRKTTNISTRLLEFRQERQEISKRNEKIRCDPLHLNTELFFLSLLLVHAFVRRRNTERGSRSIGSRIRRSLGPSPTTRFRDPFSFIYHCLLRHFHSRPG